MSDQKVIDGEVLVLGYNLPDVIRLLWLVHRLSFIEKRFKIAPLMRHVERHIDEVSIKTHSHERSFCSRGTFDTYLKAAKDLPEGMTDVYGPFGDMMEKISIEAFKAIIQFLNKRKPDCVIDADSVHESSALVD